jgi:hypothetical protein
VKKFLVGNDTYLSQKCLFALLNLVAKGSFASSECRAEALYLLAIECLEQGRQLGELIHLWFQNSNRGQYVVEIDNRIPHLMRAKPGKTVSSASGVFHRACVFTFIKKGIVDGDACFRS